MRRSSNNEPKRIPRLGRGASPCFSEKVLCAGKGLKPPFKTAIPPQKHVRPKFDIVTYGYFVCLYRNVPMLVPKTIWRGKVGTPEKCACIVIVLVSSVPVSNIYCTLKFSQKRVGSSCVSRKSAKMHDAFTPCASNSIVNKL